MSGAAHVGVRADPYPSLDFEAGHIAFVAPGFEHAPEFTGPAAIGVGEIADLLFHIAFVVVEAGSTFGPEALGVPRMSAKVFDEGLQLTPFLAGPLLVVLDLVSWRHARQGFGG